MPPSPILAGRFRNDLIALTGETPGPDRRLGVAVSGGPDSLALLLLVHAAFPDAIAAATVDHGIRPEAADEARFVEALCTDLGVPHATLRNDRDIGIRGTSGTQQWARALRYLLLANWAMPASVKWIATAHHADDQAETLLMRVARGAGLSGASGIRPIGQIHGLQFSGVALVRPLLGWRRAELARIVSDAGIVPVEDPSNASPAYDRTAFRALLAANSLLDPPRLAASASHFRESDEAIEWMVDRCWKERAEIEDRETVILDPAGLPRELRRRLLKRAIDHLWGEFGLARRYRLDTLDRLLIRLDRGDTGTIAQFVARPGPPWRIEPAPPRRNR